MSQPITLQATNRRRPSRIGQIILTVLACAALLIGSAGLSYIWLRMSTYGPISYTLGLTFLMTIVFLVPILGLTWLFGMAALLLARRWMAAGFSLPVALGVYAGLYLFIVFVIPHVPAPALVFVALLVALNGVALWLARRFLTGTVRKTA